MINYHWFLLYLSKYIEYYDDLQLIILLRDFNLNLKYNIQLIGISAITKHPKIVGTYVVYKYIRIFNVHVVCNALQITIYYII